MEVRDSFESVLREPGSRGGVLALVSCRVRGRSAGFPFDLTVDWFLVWIVVVNHEYCGLSAFHLADSRTQVPLSVLL